MSWMQDFLKDEGLASPKDIGDPKRIFAWAKRHNRLEEVIKGMAAEINSRPAHFLGNRRLQIDNIDFQNETVTIRETPQH